LTERRPEDPIGDQQAKAGDRMYRGEENDLAPGCRAVVEPPVEGVPKVADLDSANSGRCGSLVRLRAADRVAGGPGRRLRVLWLI